MPDPALVRLLARRLGVAQEEIVVTSGATEANLLACVALLRAGDEVAVEIPTYPPLAQAPELLGARVRRIARLFGTGFAIERPLPVVRLTILSSPHNPSGARLDADAIAAVAEESHGYVLVDEVFREIAENPFPTSRRAHARALATGSLTKAQGLPGLRLGWLLAPREVAERARAAKVLTTLAAGALDQAMALRALEAQPAGASVAVERRKRNLPLVEVAVRRAHLEWVRPEAGLCCVVRVPGDDHRLAEHLLARGLHVVPGSTLGLPGTLRIGFGGPTAAVASALDAFVDALNESPSAPAPA
jgi:aspartate/methionine/tyrosine aminotransferase